MSDVDRKKAASALTKIAGSSLVNLIFGFIRMKLAAITVGPIGVGVIGYLQQVLTVCSSFFALGTREAVVYNVAKQNGTSTEIDTIVFLDTLKTIGAYLAIIGGITTYVLTYCFLQDGFSEYKQINYAVLSLGVGVIIYSGVLLAILNGKRNVNSLAKVTMYSSIFGAVIGSLIMLYYEASGIEIFVILSGVCTLLFAAYYNYRVGISPIPKLGVKHLDLEVKIIFKLGIPVMISTFVVALSHLLIREIIEKNNGLMELGYFTSAWMISQYYIGFFYTSIASDFYPAVAALERQDERVPVMLNDQIKLGIIFTAPLFVGLSIFAEIAIYVAFSTEFMPAVNVLYWLILGDLIKTLTQPLSSVLMSFAEGRTYLTVRSIISVTYVGLAFVLVPYYGVAGVGVAYVAAYIIHFYIMRRIIKKLIVWELSSENIILVTLVIISIVTAMSLSNTDDVSVLSYGLCIFILITWIFFALVKIYESLSAREG